MEVFEVPWRATCSRFVFFVFFPLAVMIGSNVAAGMEEPMCDIRTPGGNKRLCCGVWAFRGCQKKELLHKLTYKNAISYKTPFPYSDNGCAVLFSFFLNFSCFVPLVFPVFLSRP